MNIDSIQERISQHKQSRTVGQPYWRIVICAEYPINIAKIYWQFTSFSFHLAHGSVGCMIREHQTHPHFHCFESNLNDQLNVSNGLGSLEAQIFLISKQRKHAVLWKMRWGKCSKHTYYRTVCNIVTCLCYPKPYIFVVPISIHYIHFLNTNYITYIA